MKKSVFTRVIVLALVACLVLSIIFYAVYPLLG